MKATLLFDAIAWHDEDGTRHEANGKGTEVDLPSDEFDRLFALTAVAKPGSKAADKTAEEDGAAAPEAPSPEDVARAADLAETYSLNELRKMAKEAGSTAKMPDKLAAAAAFIAAEG